MNGSYIGKPTGGKLLRMNLEWEHGLIRGISIRGDFFAHPEDGFDESEAALIGTPVEHVGQTFAKEITARGVTLFGLSPEDVGIAVASILASSNGA